MHKTTSLHTCKNCDAPIDGNYCAVCGQKSTVSKITIKETFQQIIDMFFSVNTPLMITLKYAFINPGKLFREFIEGKRKTYYKPVPFFILMTVLYVLLSSLLGSHDIKLEMLKSVSSDSSKMKLFYAGEFMLNNVTNFLFFFAFSMGVSLKLLFRKRYTLAEYFVIAFYIVGIYILLVSCFMYFINKLVLSLRFITLLLMLIYFFYAISSLFQKVNFKIFFKGVIAYCIAVFLYILFSFGLSLLITSF